MDVKRGTVVKSLHGRDSGYFLIVTGFDGGRILVADGRERPLERPKQKNIRHIEITEDVLPEAALRGNRALKKALAAYTRSQSEVK